MSDMEQSDLVAPQPEPTAEELQAEIDAEKQQLAALQALVDQVNTTPPVVPVVAQAPSSASTTQQPESAPGVEKVPLSLEDAARALLIFVKAHRTAGDADLEAAVADVEAALAQEA